MLSLYVILNEWLAFYGPLGISIDVVTYRAVWLLHGWCHMKLLPPQHFLCLPYNHVPCVMSLQAKPHTHGACVFSSNLPPALLVEWPGFSMCYFGDMQMEWILKILPSILLGFKPATFWSWVWYSNHWVIPAPVIWNRFPVGVTVTSMTSLTICACFCIV